MLQKFVESLRGEAHLPLKQRRGNAYKDVVAARDP